MEERASPGAGVLSKAEYRAGKGAQGATASGEKEGSGAGACRDTRDVGG